MTAPLNSETATSGDGLTIQAPAKLNLFLHVLGRRADGYHELQSVFQLIDLADELTIRPRRDGILARPLGAHGVLESDDLVIRAADCLRQAAGDLRLGADIRVVKNIPQGAGMGGGSSDAASTLIALNHLWGLGFSTLRLAEIGLQLGADVPFFVHGVNALVSGIGEIIEPISTPSRWFSVIYPGVSVATQRVFQAPELKRNSRKITIGGLLDWNANDGLIGCNDLQPVAIAVEPVIGEALQHLERFAPARMTGSGSAVFAAFGDPAKARQAIQALPPEWSGWVVQAVTRSPRVSGLV